MGSALAAEVEVLADHITGTVEGVEAAGDVRLYMGNAALTAERMRWAYGEPLYLEAPRLEPCGACGGGIWALTAREAWVEDDALRFTGGRVTLGRVPVFAWPAGRLRLSQRRAGVSLPAIGRGANGLEAALPLWLRVGAGRLTVAPGWSMNRGFRGRAGVDLEGEGTAVEVSGAAGWDRAEKAPRGLLEGTATASAGRFEAAASGWWVSDGTYLDDYSGDVLYRGQPWSTHRAALGWGPARLQWTGWQEQAPQTDGVASLLVRDEARALGPVRLTSWARGDAAVGARSLTGEIGASAATLHHLGPVELSALGEGRAMGPDRGLEGRAELGAGLPMWADHGRWRHELVLGARAGVGDGLFHQPDRAEVPLTVTDPLGVAWAGLLGTFPLNQRGPEGVWLGPAVESRWLGPGGARLELDARVPYGTEGLGWAGGVSLAAGGWSVRGSGVGRNGAWRAVGLVQRSGDILSATAGVRAQEDAVDVYQGVAAADLKLQRSRGVWQPGVDLVARPDAVAAAGASLSLSLACGCVTVGGRIGYAEDREGPQVAVWGSLSPVISR
ncbi:MAG: hypothetical protein H6739_37405 [Alphaproteobacteria bacterium]|nr:hypothetical protein [Alphaproteobacteria bacterium]